MTIGKSYSLVLNAGKPNTLDNNAQKALSLGAKEAFAVAVAKDGEIIEFKTVEDLWQALKSFQGNGRTVISSASCTSDHREMKP